MEVTCSYMFVLHIYIYIYIYIHIIKYVDTIFVQGYVYISMCTLCPLCTPTMYLGGVLHVLHTHHRLFAYASMHNCKHVFIYAHIYIYIYTYTHICMHIIIYVCSKKKKKKHTHAYIYVLYDSIRRRIADVPVNIADCGCWDRSTLIGFACCKLDKIIA